MARRLPTASTANSSQLQRAFFTRWRYDAMEASRAGERTQMDKHLPPALTATSSPFQRVAGTRWRYDATKKKKKKDFSSTAARRQKRTTRLVSTAHLS